MLSPLSTSDPHRSPDVAAATGASALPSLGTRWECDAANIAGKYECVVGYVLEILSMALGKDKAATFLCARILKVRMLRRAAMVFRL